MRADHAPMPRATANGIEIEYETFGDRGADPMLLVMGLGGQMILWYERARDSGKPIDIVIDNSDTVRLSDDALSSVLQSTDQPPADPGP